MRDISPTITRMYCARSGICSVDAQQLLDRHRVADVVEHRRDVVQPIGVREDLRLGRVLRLLLEAAVQVAELDVGAGRSARRRRSSTMRTVPCIAGCDGPMLSGMGSVGSSGASPRSGGVLEAEDDAAGLGGRQRCFRSCACRASVYAVPAARRHQRLALLLGVVLAQRVADELRVHEDAAQVGVALEADAVQVEGLALEPVRRPATAAPACRRVGSSSGTPA